MQQNFRHAQEAQLMLCSETCPKTKMKMLLLTAIAVRSFSRDVILEINSCQVSASLKPHGESIALQPKFISTALP